MSTTLDHIIGERHSKVAMLDFMVQNPNQFKRLMDMAISPELPNAWRAAWLVSLVMKKNDERVLKKSKDIIDAIAERKDGHQRCLLKIFGQLDLNESNEGYLFDQCMTIWEDIHKDPSVRIIAFNLLVKTAKKHPDLINEILLLGGEYHSATLSPGIKNSFDKLIQSIKNNKNDYKSSL